MVLLPLDAVQVVVVVGRASWLAFAGFSGLSQGDVEVAGQIAFAVGCGQPDFEAGIVCEALAGVSATRTKRSPGRTITLARYDSISSDVPCICKWDHCVAR